jgi:hypothetical protein
MTTSITFSYIRKQGSYKKRGVGTMPVTFSGPCSDPLKHPMLKFHCYNALTKTVKGVIIDITFIKAKK